jgi:hypothetical protein
MVNDSFGNYGRQWPCRCETAAFSRKRSHKKKIDGPLIQTSVREPCFHNSLSRSECHYLPPMNFVHRRWVSYYDHLERSRFYTARGLVKTSWFVVNVQLLVVFHSRNEEEASKTTVSGCFKMINCHNWGLRLIKMLQTCKSN